MVLFMLVVWIVQLYVMLVKLYRQHDLSQSSVGESYIWILRVQFRHDYTILLLTTFIQKLTFLIWIQVFVWFLQQTLGFIHFTVLCSWVFYQLVTICPYKETPQLKNFYKLNYTNECTNGSHGLTRPIMPTITIWNDLWNQLTAMEKDEYESPLTLHVLWSPKGLPFWVQIAGMINRRMLPKFPLIKTHINKQQMKKHNYNTISIAYEKHVW